MEHQVDFIILQVRKTQINGSFSNKVVVGVTMNQGEVKMEGEEKIIFERMLHYKNRSIRFWKIVQPMVNISK